MDAKNHLLRVLMFPWLAHGHIFPYLELAKKLSKKQFYIYFCSTPINLSFINEHLDQNSIELVELHLPTVPDLPPNYHTTKSLPPHLMSTLKTAFDMAELSFSHILRTLNPDLLVYDFIQPWAPTVASSLNITAIHFLTGSAVASDYMYQLCKSPENVVFPSTMHLEEHEDQRMLQQLESTTHGLSNKDRFLEAIDQSNTLVLIKTFREIEDKYIDHLSFITGKEMVPVGPLVQEPTNDGKQSSFIEWLDKKHKSSTVFVSFGSEYYMSREEIEETSHGLELSGVNFIWVIRFPEGENAKLVEVLPQGFMGRIGERGLVVEGWAPQVEILGHPSIGGFVSHCGWSSVMEGIKFGIPIVATPMHLDQPVNAKLVVEVGVGMEVERESSGPKTFVRDELAKVIKEVVVDRKGGNPVQRRVREISEKIRKQGEEGFDDLVIRLLHLCGKIKAEK
ncbi:hypothetical protein Syun_010872 [Stephania yunnanensis]|uniref:Glycosyltransferase n=1 Tax=Stephania yunnanensis TaxID=152371 RepID=A0AAP0PEW8_9MAGN